MGWKIANYPVPVANIPQIFGDIDWAIQRHGLAQITQHFLQCQARAQAVAIRVFGLDDNDVIGRLDELLGGIKHSLIIADETQGFLKLHLSAIIFSANISCNMFEIPYATFSKRSGETRRVVEVCPMWDIGTPESNPVCEFVRRIRGLGRIAIRKEHIDWIFDDLLYNHKNTQYRLEKGQLPETQGYIKSRPIESFLSRYIATTGDQREKTYDLRKDLEVSVIYMVFQLNKVANTEGIEKKELTIGINL